MSEHTPGPWKLETVKTSVGLCHKIGPFPWKKGKMNHACVYDDYPAVNGGTPELVANARLIAQAWTIPVLREALEGMLMEWDKFTRYGSPMAKAANERVSAAQVALKLGQDNG